jgi:hypothetical protein
LSISGADIAASLGDARPRGKKQKSRLRTGRVPLHLEQTHKAVSKADDMRYAIEALMYEKALIPESRGDLLGCLKRRTRCPGSSTGFSRPSSHNASGSPMHRRFNHGFH